ncbi:MAG: formate dehydrogenase accessory sulfurtransferase FdhD [Fulvivirga sp.]|nr:formate dehydrogenase accessory sulfurtransferase FdhD [Fulvivirga sp.]
MRHAKVSGTDVIRKNRNIRESRPDLLAVEEPMEIRLLYGDRQERQEKSLAVTMRTPGNDFELAMGFLFTEGIIESYDDVMNIAYCQQVRDADEQGNVVQVSLVPTLNTDLSKISRNFFASSSCGVCGKASLESIKSYCQPISSELKIDSENIIKSPDIMRKSQQVFEHTGGLHACALFDDMGKLILLREDIGRHNAMDKLIGAALLEGMVPLNNYFITVSGRVGFELIQKSTVAGTPVICAVGAPSSLAVDMAKNYKVTLVGFLRNGSYNIYSEEDRIL